MKNGVVYTPDYIVEDMLNIIKKNNNFENKKIIDPACGDGAFLKKIVKDILENKNIKNKKNYLEQNIYGVDIDAEAINICKESLNMMCTEYNICNITWKIENEDFFEFYQKNQNKFDVVIGNPPYIRTHDISKSINFENMKLTNQGMKDLYLMFYEGSLELLNNDGILLFISPNSYFTSLSGTKFREYLIENNLLEKIIDLGHFNPFKNATAYTCITKLNKNYSNSNILYSTYDGIESEEKKIKYDDFYVNKNYYFNLIENNKDFYDILRINKKYNMVKNAISTNLDSFYHKFQSKTKHTRKSIKLSNGKLGLSFFPYTEEGLIEYEKLTETEKKLLKANEENLKSRDLRGQNWYGYARTQGIKDTFKLRVGFNNLIRSAGNLKIYLVDPGVVVYSGYYLVINNQKEFDEIKNLLNSEHFFNYIKVLNKQKNGNYYHFNTKDVEKYIIYMRGKNE